MNTMDDNGDPVNAVLPQKRQNDPPALPEVGQTRYTNCLNDIVGTFNELNNLEEEDQKKCILSIQRLLSNYNYIEFRFLDEGYTNWSKICLCFQMVKECLKDFTLKHAKDNHETLLKNVNAKGLTCTCSETKQVREIQSRKQKLRQIRCDECKQWLTAIENQAHTKSVLVWANTELSKVKLEPWELAKVYQPIGCKDHSGPVDADAVALLTYIERCEVFSGHINRMMVKEVIEIRHKVFHSPTMKLASDELWKYQDKITALLTDDDAHLLERDQSLKQIEMICAKTKIIDKEDERNIFQDISRNIKEEQKALTENSEQGLSDEDLARLEQLKKENQKIMSFFDFNAIAEPELKTALTTTIDSIEDVCQTLRNQEVEKLKKDVKVLQKEVQKGKEDLKVLQEEVHNARETFLQTPTTYEEEIRKESEAVALSSNPLDYPPEITGKCLPALFTTTQAQPSEKKNKKSLLDIFYLEQAADVTSLELKLGILELYKVQAAIAIYLEVGLISASNFPQLSEKIKKSAHKARLYHEKTLGMMKTFIDAAIDITGTKMPRIVGAVKLADGDLITDAYKQIIDLASDMKKEAEDTKSRYYQVQADINKNMNSVAVTQDEEETRANKRQEELEKEKQKQIEIEQERKKQEDELVRRQEKLNKYRTVVEEGEKSKDAAVKAQEDSKTDMLGNVLSMPVSITGGAPILLKQGVEMAKSVLSYMQSDKQVEREKEKLQEQKEKKKREKERLRQVEEDLRLQRQEELETLRKVKALLLEDTENAGNVESLKDALMVLGIVDKQLSKIADFWEDIVVVVSYISNKSKAGEVFIKKIADERYSKRFLQRLEADGKSWEIFKGICGDYVAVCDRSPEFAVDTIYGFLSTPVDNMTKEDKKQRKIKLFATIENNLPAITMGE